jgi:hypothetical protein
MVRRPRLARRRTARRRFAALVTAAVAAAAAATSSPLLRAAVGDPQLKTDHPWYPGELACSTFDRLFATQAAAYTRATGRPVTTDEDKALASWYWRNLHYAHGEEGRQDCFAAGFDKAEWNRDYWTGLFAHGFGLCGTTHAQWTAEMNALLGHCRGRVVGVSGHNSFEAFLTGGAYGAGRWALLDHDLSTVVFAPDGSRLLSIPEVAEDLARLTDPAFKPERQRGWRVSALHDADAKAYDTFRSAEYLAGYAGPPPMVHLRAGESLRRYLEPGMNDRDTPAGTAGDVVAAGDAGSGGGKTFAFWGMNYDAAGVPGLARDRTWVNQPEKMFGSKAGSGGAAGRARYGNAVYGYAPDFKSGSYKQGVVEESTSRVVFEFRTPYVIAATPPADAKGASKRWGVYDPGCTNGLLVQAGGVPAEVSVDGGKTWHAAERPAGVAGPVDLTDFVKGHNQYRLAFKASAVGLVGKDISWRTVCQANPAVFPRLHDGMNRVTYEASGLGLVSAGPTRDQAAAHVVGGAMGTNTVTLELKTPRGEKPVRVYAAGWVASGNPPDAKTAYAIDLSADGGKTWRPVVADWHVVRRGPEPADFWSQSFVWGEAAVQANASSSTDVAAAGAGVAGASPAVAGPVRVRFTNNGGKTFRKVEAHLAYAVADPSPVDVSFAWTSGGGGGGGGGDRGRNFVATRRYGTLADGGGSTFGFRSADGPWTINVGDGVVTRWVEMRAR